MPVVNEYQLFRGHWPLVRYPYRALPEGGIDGAVEPSARRFYRSADGDLRHRKRLAASFLGGLLNIPCSPAWLVKTQSLVSDAVTAPYEELRGCLAEQKQLNRRPEKQKAWMFAAVAVTFEALGISANRNRESRIAGRLIGECQGI